MKEIVREFTVQKVDPTFFQGSKAIDEVWAMADIEISNACIMLAGYGGGDHCMIIMDIVKSSLVGEILFHVQWLVLRQLNRKAPGGGAAKYIATLESSLVRHRLIEELGRAHKRCGSEKEFRCRINKIGSESKEPIKHAKKVCQ
jgi:hypothetical protein